jgi:hypothetical protein
MPAKHPPACLVVCAGKDCRNAKGFDMLCDTASACPGSLRAACQGLCHGPIVGVQTRHGIRWFSRVRTRKMRAALVTAATTGKISKRLRANEVRKRRNVVRHPGRLVDLAA